MQVVSHVTEHARANRDTRPLLILCFGFGPVSSFLSSSSPSLLLPSASALLFRAFSEGRGVRGVREAGLVPGWGPNRNSPVAPEQWRTIGVRWQALSMAPPG